MSPARRLLVYASRYRRTFIQGLAAIVITTVIQLSAPWVLKYAVDDLQQGVTVGKLRLYAVLLLLLAAVGGVFRFVMRRLIIGASRDIEYDLRNDFFAHRQR
jgi:ATP-binding cassette subfamily B protein